MNDDCKPRNTQNVDMIKTIFIQFFQKQNKIVYKIVTPIKPL